MNEYMVLMPMTDNFTEVLAIIKEEALATFGGYTLGGPVTGAWLDLGTGIVHEDWSWPLTIALTPALETEFFRFVRRVRVLLNQITMYVRLPNGEVVFVGSE